MVLRPSSSSWSIAPETIMSHHYRLTRGVRGKVDTSPPFSMYNSPISVHYIPKRASSADAAKRRQPKLPRPHRELSEFVGAPYGRTIPPLQLPHSLTGTDVKSKLLQSRDYQPPLHRSKQKTRPPLPPGERSTWTEEPRKRRTEKQKQKDNFCFDLFKDAVYTYVIDREVFTDGVIAEAVDIEIEKWSNQISWDDLEYLRSEIFDELGVRSTHFASEPTKTSKKDTKKKSRSSTSTGSRSTTPTSSGSSLSEMKSNSERVSESDSDSSSTSEESDGSSAHSGSKSGSNNSTASSSSSK
ncbi:hypothetical protein Y032_0003g1171 [Ancylostoma ceylanicum]|uniref:Uncharacterized protein n=1 Tax=Ancylostoma ceylanicum TaxID=53326 RepID=A0A016VXB9_9BILA|nr:hypothetical protein Y032_0003g1171 [Ancylostoma ceylanicum]